MIKFLITLLFLGTAGVVAINQIPSLKQKTLELVNPARKTARVLNDLQGNLNQLDASLATAAKAKSLADAQRELKTSATLLISARGLAGSATELAADPPGLMQATVGKLVDALIDKTPFPADHLKPAVTCPQ